MFEDVLRKQNNIIFEILFCNGNSITIVTFLSNPELIRACHGLKDLSQRLAEMLASLKIQEAVF